MSKIGSLLWGRLAQRRARKKSIARRCPGLEPLEDRVLLSFTPIMLPVTSGTVGAADSADSVGPSAELVFLQQPTDAVINATISPAVTVEVEDANGNLVTTDNSDVTLFIAGGSDLETQDGLADGTLSGTLTVPASGGIATFSDLAISDQGTYTLEAVDGALTPTISSAFNITPTPGTPVVSAQPKITLTGNDGQTINKGSSRPSAANGTDFGSVLLGTPGVDQTYTITNTGKGTMRLGRIKVSKNFILVAPPGNTIIPSGDSTTFTVGLNTSKLGTLQGTVTFARIANLGSPFQFNVKGTVTLGATPTIGSMATSGPVAQGSPLTLQAGFFNIAEPSGVQITKVLFYQDTPGTGVFKPGKDKLLGAGVFNNRYGDFTLTIPTAKLPVGTVTFFAQAVDNYGRRTPAASVTTQITAPT